MTISPDQDPNDEMKRLEVNIQLPDGPPPAPEQFQVRFFVFFRADSGAPTLSPLANNHLLPFFRLGLLSRECQTLGSSSSFFVLSF